MLDLIEQLSPAVDDLITTLGKSTAIQPVHQWQTDTYRAAGTQTVAEGSAFSALALTTPVRATNICEIVRVDLEISGTQQATAHYGMADAVAYQKMKGMQEWENAAEFDLVRSTLVSGISGTTPRMAGLIAFVSTNLTAQTSGTVFSESVFNGLLELAWTNGSGEAVTDVYVGSILKRRISQFSANGGTKWVQTTTKEVVATIDAYVSDFGACKVHLHRYVQQSSDATARILGIVQNKWRVAYLQSRTPKMEQLAKVGDSDRYFIVGELTLECLNEPTNFFASGYLKTS